MGESQSYKACMGVKWKCLGFYWVSLKIEEDPELNIVFTAVTQIFAKWHFLRYELRSWCLRLGLVFRVEDQSFKVKNDLRTLYLRKYTRERS